MPSQRDKTQRVEARINERLADGVKSIDQIDQIYGRESREQGRSEKGKVKRGGEERDSSVFDTAVRESHSR
jgi:hypothetical protein